MPLNRRIITTSSTPMTIIVPDIKTPNTDRVTGEESHESENKVIGGAEHTSADMSQTDGKCEYGAAVQTRAKSEEVNQKKKQLKVVHVPGTEVTTEELIELQKADETIEKYWDLLKQPSNINKNMSFIEKKGILYRSYSDKRGDEIRLQLVVPKKLTVVESTVAFFTNFTSVVFSIFDILLPRPMTLNDLEVIYDI